jgi:hypothetical protein
MRGRRLSLAVLGVTVALGSSSILQALEPGEAMAKGGKFVIPASRTGEFQLKGSRGFSISVSARSHQVSLQARKGALSASYSTRGIFSSKRIKAGFGNLGSVSVRFKPSGRPRRHAPAENCEGADTVVQPGRFVGTVRFEGEQAYTTVRASKAKGKLTFTPRQVCRNEGEGGPPLHLTTLTATSRSEGVVFVALKIALGGPGFSAFGATLLESQGGLLIARSTEAKAGASAFTTSGQGREITSATITPPSPFTGSATYEKQKGLPATWTGSLAGTFLGRGEVSLVGPQFTAEASG